MELGWRREVREDLFPLYKYQSFSLLVSTWFLMPHFTMSVLHTYLLLLAKLLYNCMVKIEENGGKYSFQRKSSTVLEKGRNNFCETVTFLSCQSLLLI